MSRAIQYVQPVEDPKDVSSDVEDAVQELDRELNAVQQDPNITLADAEARLNSVLERFNALGGWLAQQREEKDSD